MYVCEGHPCCAIWRLLSHTGVSVLPLRRNCVKRERMFEDDIFIENTCLGSGSKRRTKFTRWRSFKQVTWFSWPMFSPRLNMCASTIFVVGTSGIPPKLNYRSVKSYSSNYIYSMHFFAAFWALFFLLHWEYSPKEMSNSTKCHIFCISDSPGLSGNLVNVFFCPFLDYTQGSYYYWHSDSFKMSHFFPFHFAGFCIYLFYYTYSDRFVIICWSWYINKKSWFSFIVLYHIVMGILLLLLLLGF